MADRIARVWNGSTWEPITAMVSIPNAVAFYQSSAPSSPSTGTVWIDSDDDTLYVWSGSSWISTSIDLSAYATQTELNNKENSIPLQNTAPSSPETSDLWVDNTNSAKPILKTYNGSSWVEVGSTVEADSDQIIISTRMFA